MSPSSIAWRSCFALCGVLILIGGPRHPGGTMAEMLAHPDWMFSHAVILVGFIALLVGLRLYERDTVLTARVHRWTRIAMLGTALQAIEMGFHTASVVDLDRLTAGTATPILTTHLVLSVAVYPIFGLTTIGFILATARDRALASPWVAWIGVLGAAAHGTATILVVLLGLDEFRFLFPAITLFALWLVLAALWPIRATAAGPVSEAA